jgi:hypothetical protein
MKKIVLFFLSLCLSTWICAQNTGEIKGKIFDSKTKEPLTGATVFVEYMGVKIADFVDKDGQFTLKPLNPGKYNVTITFTGYDTASYSGVSVNTDKITFLDDTYLEFGVFSKKELVVHGRTLIDPEAPSKISISQKEIEAMPDSKNINSVIRDIFTDIYVSDDGDEIYFRGSRNGDAAYYVDGVKCRDNQTHIPGNAIGSLTVYTGGVPAKYGDFTGGVVVIETQSYFSWLNEQRSK